MIVTVVVSPATHVVGEIEEIDGCAHSNHFARGRTRGKSAIKAVKKAWRRGGMVLELPPQFTQELAHGCSPFVVWLRVVDEKRPGAIVPRIAGLLLRKNKSLVTMAKSAIVRRTEKPVSCQ